MTPEVASRARGRNVLKDHAAKKPTVSEFGGQWPVRQDLVNKVHSGSWTAAEAARTRPSASHVAEMTSLAWRSPSGVANVAARPRVSKRGASAPLARPGLKPGGPACR